MSELIKKHLLEDVPVVYFDLETTDADPDYCRTVTLSACSNGVWKSWLFDPCILISPGASKVHGYIDIDVIGKPKFSDCVQDIYPLFDRAYWCAYNGHAFDFKIIKREFELAGHKQPVSLGKIDPYRIFLKYCGKAGRGQRTLSAAYSHYCQKEIVNAHDAKADTSAMIEILHSQIAVHGIKDMDTLIEASVFYDRKVDKKGFFIFKGRSLMACSGFGRFSGMPMNQIPASYYKWLIANNFPDDVKEIAKKAIMGYFPRRPI